jgi:DNA gyrase subunit B
VNITDNFDIEVAFAYDKTLDECIINSYCNYVITTEGGYHETVAQRAICDFFVRESKKLDPNSKYEVTYEDCKAGLIIAVNCKHIDPAYEGQHKSRVSNKDVLDDGKKGLNDALYKYFNYNNALLRKIINFLRQNVRARLEAHKIKGVVTKKQTTFLDDSSIPGFYPLSDRNYSGYTELIIAEGDSAGNAINKCRNSRYQAIYATMGVVDNVYGLSVKQMMDKPIFRNLTTILGCGVGSDFDINKLKYSKIIMEADADADGNNISSLVFVYFITFMPQLILQGKLYKALPPLLRLNPKVSKWYKGSLWLFNKEEYYDIINKIISENTEVALVDEETDVITSMNKREMIKWLELNSEYLTELDRLEKRTACNPTVLEYICYYKLITATEPNELKFKSLIEAKFTELRYDIADRNLVGSFNGEFISTVIDSLFMKISKKFISILADNPTIQIYCKNRNESNDKFELMSIGGFLALMDRTFEVKIEQRYKGLGEAGSEILFITTLNPKVRKLVRFTIEDMKSTLETFELLHAKNDVMRQKRRDLLDNSTISLMDLDN